MYAYVESPVKPVEFGQGAKITLDHFYDILKLQVGGLKTDEYLQLKLVADTIDLSSEGAAKGGYKWFSTYNLLRRSDESIAPIPIGGGLQTAVEDLSTVYGKFLNRLRSFVVLKNLTPEEQVAVADIDKQIGAYQDDLQAYYEQDATRWETFAKRMGFKVGDQVAYVQWSSRNGNLRKIEEKMKEIQKETYKKKTILDRQYPDPDDRQIVEAEFAFEDPAMRLRYPIHPDYDYPNGSAFDLGYLANMPLGSTGLFDDRRVVQWNLTIGDIKTKSAGAIAGTLDRNTAESRSISTDWSAGGSVSYGFFSVRASASEHRSISEDFSKATKINLASKSSLKVQINPAGWFKPNLFSHKRVRENIRAFEDFFGPNGTLLYYPTELILVRGFSVEFESSQNWAYDYARSFSASGGGGFRVFGIGFGASSSYSSHEKEHKVDQSGTKLKISDDENSIRFVGYAVRKNTVFENAVIAAAGEFRALEK